MPKTYYRILLPDEWLREQSSGSTVPADLLPQLPEVGSGTFSEIRPEELPSPHITTPEPLLPWSATVAMLPNRSAVWPVSGTSNINETGNPAAFPAENPESGASESLRPVTKAELEEIVDRKLSALKVYVLESEITQAQQAVKSVVELASF